MSNIETKTKLQGRGGAGRGQGRKLLFSEPTRVVHVLMTRKQADAVTKMGGSSWLRSLIESATGVK